MERATRFVLQRPRIVWLVAGLLAVASLAVTAFGLRMKTSRLDLLNPKSEYNQRWLAYLEAFGEDDDVVVVVEDESPQRVRDIVDKLADRLAARPDLYPSILHRYQLRAFRRKGLHFLTPEQLTQVERLVRQLEPVLGGQWNRLAYQSQWSTANVQLERLAANGGAASSDVIRSVADELAGQASRMLAAVEPKDAETPLWPRLQTLTQINEQFDDRYLEADQGRMGLLLVRISRNQQGFAGANEALVALRQLIEQVRTDNPGLSVGVTGLPVLENDEMQASQRDMMRASIISLAGVAILFVAGFGSVRYPVMTVGCLVLAIVWSFGYITLAVGHLNILSVSFGVILIGLGIDFGIHYVARYLQVRGNEPDVREALTQTSGSVGPGIIAGGITTALAFCTASLTDFTGVAELGIIAGGGIVLCIAAALLVLPPTVLLFDRSDTPIRPVLPIGAACAPLSRFPRLLLLLSLLVTAGLAMGVGRLRIDHNLLHLQPEDIESVQVERRLLEATDQSVWFALSVSKSIEELRSRKAEFEKLATVERTEEVISLLPATDTAREQRIRQLQARLEKLPDAVPQLVVGSIEQLELTLQETARLLGGLQQIGGPAAPSVAAAAGQVQRIRRWIADTPRAASLAQLTRGQQRLAEELMRHLRALANMTDPSSPRLEDLPANLATRFVGRQGQFLLKVYARGDVWDMDALERFVAELESVDPQVTGHPVQTHYASRQMTASYVHAAIYSLLAVSIVLVIDFRRVRDTLLALTPLLLGMLQLLGLLGWLGIALNPANLLVLPLILGIGIDDGVHVVHDFRRQAGRYRVSNSTALGVLLTSATTIIGFGSMMLAQHRGLRSLGQVLTLGVACCLVTSLVTLPAVLQIVRGTVVEPEADSALEDDEV